MDGSQWNDPSAVISNGPKATAKLSFESPASIKAILIQGDWNDVYVFEGSVDGAAYTPIWYAPIETGSFGLWRRWIVLDEKVTVSSVRVRAARTDGALSISEIQLFSDVPENWGELTKENSANPKFQWSAWLQIGKVEAIKEIISGLGMLLLFWYVISPAPSKLRNGLMISIAFAAAAGWCNFFQFHFGTLIHRHEFFHYYLGSKYSPELGYTKLYECTVVADKEDSFLLPIETRVVRNLENNTIETASRILLSPEACTSRFSKERWSSFKTDLKWFREALTRDEYFRALKDHGYNATPIWNFNGYLLSNLAPASTGFLYALGLMDGVILTAAFIFAGLTFGLPAMFASLLFFSSNFIASFAWTGAAFLRADWVAAALIGVSLLKREHWRLGGLVLVFAGLTRVFPFALLGGVFLREVALFAKRRAISPEFIKISQGAALGALVLIGLSTIPSSGFKNWEEFIANTKKHFHTLSTNVMGLKIIVGFSPSERTFNLEDTSLNDPFELWKKKWNERIKARGYILLLSQAALLAFIVIAAIKLPPWGASVVGICLVLFINLSNYDYYALAPFGLLTSIVPIVGFLIGLLAWTSWAIPTMFQAMDEVYFASSILVLVFIVAALTCITRKSAD